MKSCKNDFFQSYLYWFHPILVTWFLVDFGAKVTKISCNSLFFILSCRENHTTKGPKKPKKGVTKIYNEPGIRVHSTANQ